MNDKQDHQKDITKLGRIVAFSTVLGILVVLGTIIFTVSTLQPEQKSLLQETDHNTARDHYLRSR